MENKHTRKRLQLFIKITLNLVLVLSSEQFAVGGERNAEYTGKLNKDLFVNGDGFEPIIFKQTKAVRLKTEKKLPTNAIVNSGRLYDARSEKYAMLAALVELKDEPLNIYVDLNLNGTLEESERFHFETDKNNPNFLKLMLNIPLTSSFFRSFPLQLGYLKNFKNSRVANPNLNAAQKIILQSTEIFAIGKVQLSNREFAVKFEYRPKAGKITPDNGFLGIDADGNEEIDVERFSLESAKADQETIVFRVGKNYVSFAAVDLDKNLITMREHSPAEYKNLELAVGKQMPDFAFNDINGKPHKLSDYRGKHILLNFWTTWCVQCREDVPQLKKAAAKFSVYNFEIIGMNGYEPKPQNVAKFLRENKVNWTQARYDSIKEIIKALRITNFPVDILIDGDGKIVSLGRTEKGEASLEGEELFESLNNILPQNKSQNLRNRKLQTSEANATK